MTKHQIVSVGTTATLVSPRAVHSGVDLTIQNQSDSATVYIGGPDVTTMSYGFKLLPSTAISFELAGQDEIYAVAGSNVNVSTLYIQLENE